MATNPNDIARVLNEMMKTLQELSDAQLDSVQSIVDEKIKQNEELKKIKNKEKAISKKKALEQKKKEKEDAVLEKQETASRKLAKKAVITLTQKLKDKKKEILSTDNIASMLGVSSELDAFRKVRGFFKIDKSVPVKDARSILSKEIGSIKSLTIASMGNISVVGSTKKKTSQSNDDYMVDVPDLQSEQITTLKSIDEKIALLGGQKSGGFFDFLSNLLPNIISKAMMLGEGGMLGAGALGMGKFGKWFNIPKLASGGASILKTIKNPKVAVPLVLGSVVAAGVGSMMFGKEEEQNGLPGRASGGRVGAGEAFVVGEKGPEIFTPQQNGMIIPNHKLNNKTASEDNTKKLKEIIKENTKKLSKTLTSVWGDGFKTFKKSFTVFSKAVKDKFVDVKDLVVSVISEVYENIKKFLMEKIPGFITDAGSWIVGKARGAVNLLVGGGKKETPAPMTTTPSITPTQQKPQASRLTLPNLNSIYSPNTTTEPSRAIGDYNIPKTQMYKIHQNEMIIPAAQAETMRAVLELNNEYRVSPITENTKRNNIDEKFWMTKFVPAFAAAIKVDANKTRFVPNKIASVF